jgi:hypothetical protein
VSGAGPSRIPSSGQCQKRSGRIESPSEDDEAGPSRSTKRGPCPKRRRRIENEDEAEVGLNETNAMRRKISGLDYLYIFI